MNASRLVSAAALSCGLLTIATTAHAVTAVTGTVQQMQSVGGGANAPGNGDLRIWINGVSSMCPGAIDGTWAFINSNDPNFKGVLTTITTAYVMGKPLTLYNIPSTIGAGAYCQIAWVVLGS